MKSVLVQDLLQARFPNFTPAVLAVVDTACSEGLKPDCDEIAARVIAAIEREKSYFRGSRPLEVSEVSAQLCHALAYEDELLAMSRDQLVDRYRKVAADRRETINRLASNYDETAYGHPSFDADIDSWKKKVVWSVDEAVALSLGKDPAKINSQTLAHRNSGLRREFADRKRALSSEFGDASENAMPIHLFVEWFARNELSFPGFFKTAGEHNPQDFTAKLQSEIKDLEAQVEELRNLNADLRIQLEEKQKKPDRQKSMKKLIYCISKDKYHYRRGVYGSAVSSIEKSIDNVSRNEGREISLSTNTIKSILDESADE